MTKQSNSEKMRIINKYFPDLSDKQTIQFSKLDDLYRLWNSRINVISRKDIDFLYEHHVLHSLAIAKAISFLPDTEILDVGTGGGFPGIPLAIFFPETSFLLVDSTAKKIKVVNAVIEELDLKNVKARQIRSNELKRKFDFVVSRAVSTFSEFVDLVRPNIHLKDKNAVPNGIFYLKGGDVSKEIQRFRKSVFVEEISDYFDEEYFKAKKIIYLPI